MDIQTGADKMTGLLKQIKGLISEGTFEKWRGAWSDFWIFCVTLPKEMLNECRIAFSKMDLKHKILLPFQIILGILSYIFAFASILVGRGAIFLGFACFLILLFTLKE